MKILLKDNDSDKELVPLISKVATNDNNAVFLLIQNEELRALIQNEKKENPISISNEALYFKYPHKIFFTDKMSLVITTALENHKKKFAIVFIDENDKIISDIYAYNL